MGNISVLKRNEETELAKKLEQGKEIISGIVTALPLYGKFAAGLDAKVETDPDDSEEETDEALEVSLKVLDNLMFDIEIADRKVARYGTLKDLRKVIRGKKEQDINSDRLAALAKEVQAEYRRVESEAGVKIDELKAKWDTITRARALVCEKMN
jgi:RNA polymerase primary sigma factor